MISFEENSSMINLLYVILDLFQRDIFYNTPKELLYCIDPEKSPYISSNLNSQNNDCQNICFNKARKININEKKCYLNCSIGYYIYEYNGICYENCPNGTLPNQTNICFEIINNDTNKINEENFFESLSNDVNDSNNFEFDKNIVSDKDYISDYNIIKYTEIITNNLNNDRNDIFNNNNKIESDEINKNNNYNNHENNKNGNENENKYVQKCNSLNFLNNICKISENNINNKEGIFDIFRNDYLNEELNPILLNLTKKDFTAEDNNIVYTITTSDNQNKFEYNNISSIKLGKCEEKLKNYYNISDNETLLIFKADIYEKGLYIPIIEYEVYNFRTKQK